MSASVDRNALQPQRAGLVLTALILVAAVANLNLAVANVALPSIGEHFDSSQTALDLIAVAGQDSHLFSTAHLDPATASQLIDDVLEANGSRTTLLITHRSEGLERMDDVVTLESGVLA